MRQYEMYELIFQGKTPSVSETEAAPSAVFTHEAGEKKTIRGFYDGEGCYKIRFYPQKAGNYTWKVETTMELQGPCEGSIHCQEAKKAALAENGKEAWHQNLSAAHGMVKAVDTHFEYEDGTRYSPFGTTVYALAHQEKELIAQTFETLSQAPFNKVRMCLFPKHYDFNLNEPEHFAFCMEEGRPNVRKPDYVFWKEFEDTLRRLADLGIEADLILFHPYDHWGFAELSHEDALLYLDYAVRRLSAFPNLWWSLANEYDLMDHFANSWWEDFAKQIHETDVYGHLLSNHHCIKMWDFHNPYATHCCLQYGLTQRAADFIQEYQKPVVYDEVCYEGNLAFSWGNISGFEMVHRIWTGVVRGGYVTHGEVLYQEDVRNDDAVLWWAKGGKLHGESAPRIGFLRGILEELPGPLKASRGIWDQKLLRNALKDPEKAHTIPTLIRSVAELPEDEFMAFVDSVADIIGEAGDQEVILHYLGRHCSRWIDLNLPTENSYTVEVLDIWNMTRQTAETNVSGTTRIWLPAREGMAVLAKKNVK